MASHVEEVERTPPSLAPRGAGFESTRQAGDGARARGSGFAAVTGRPPSRFGSRRCREIRLVFRNVGAVGRGRTGGGRRDTRRLVRAAGIAPGGRRRWRHPESRQRRKRMHGDPLLDFRTDWVVEVREKGKY